MLLCLIPAAALGLLSLCCTHLNFSPSCVCSPFSVWHREGLGCLFWSRQHRGTGCWAVLAHSEVYKCKKQEKVAPQICWAFRGNGEDGKRGRFQVWVTHRLWGSKSKWDQALPGGIHSGAHLLGLVWGRNTVLLLAFFWYGLADVLSCTGNVVWTPKKWD